MPLGSGVRYRVKHTSKGNVRLAFKGNRAVEAKKMGKGKLQSALAKRIGSRKY